MFIREANAQRVENYWGTICHVSMSSTGRTYNNTLVTVTSGNLIALLDLFS